MKIIIKKIKVNIMSIIMKKNHNTTKIGKMYTKIFKTLQKKRKIITIRQIRKK